MTNEVKREVTPETTPSKAEYNSLHSLIAAGPADLVLVLCLVNGEERFAVAKVRVVEGKTKFYPLAIAIKETDAVFIKNHDGDLLEVEGIPGSVIN